MHLAAFARRYSTHHLCAILDHLLGMKSAFTACKPLHDNTGILIDQNAHGSGLILWLQK
jgi:hypothetical protein